MPNFSVAAATLRWILFGVQCDAGTKVDEMTRPAGQVQ
jgi:hypothetical protein